ncbi:MAG: hypothetical protein LC792_20970 [Actinobacteria bacterium]|nr:hypothetical protein [Actinomycetota bacterium]
MPWLVATVAAARHSWRSARFVRRWDLLRLVPDWAFFAPNPGTSDYRLVARARSPDGSTGDFVEIRTGGTGLHRSVWNPRKRIAKTVHDCAQALIDLEGEALEGVQYTLAYLTLLSLVQSQVHGAGGSVQFLLFRVAPYLDEPVLVVRSGFHPLPG